ncbi:MAG: hypothetical protein B7Y90_11565 [Alphaproteobacteria bacterium 32-64-14]|nr:MAG: hypothetical protein B7Y90_11565 [Alphaproteobacteria bacterium 32-64-14]
MGEAKRKRDRHSEILRADPFCVFCGGRRAATTIDHQPPKIFFRGKRHPDDFEFAACADCNHGVSDLEQVTALWINLSGQGHLDAEGLHKKIAGVYNNNRDALPSKMDDRAAWRNAAKKFGVQLPLGADFSDFPIVRLPTEAKVAFLLSGAKIAIALYRKQLGRPFPRDGRVDVRFDANIRHAWPDRANELSKLTPFISTTSFQREDLSSQFAYRWSYTEELSTFLVMIQLGSAYLQYCCLIDGLGPQAPDAVERIPIWRDPATFCSEARQRLLAEQAV